jgi:hypothetical protein
MTHKPGDSTPEPPGGRAAERLREFIDQRFPGGTPSPEAAGEQGESDQHVESQPDRHELALRELVEAQKRLEARLDRLEQTVQNLIESQKRT